MREGNLSQVPCFRGLIEFFSVSSKDTRTVQVAQIFLQMEPNYGRVCFLLGSYILSENC